MASVPGKHTFGPRLVVVALSTATLLAVAAAPSAGAAKVKFGARHSISSTFTIANDNALACPPGKSLTATTCYIVGAGPGGTPPPGITAQPPDDYLNEIVPVRGGKPQTPIPFPGAESGSLIACTSATSCVIAGYSTTYSKAAIIPVTSGTPGTPIAVPGIVGWSAIECTSATSCLAVGEVRKSESSSSAKGAIIRLHGHQATEKIVRGTSDFDGVSCFSAKTCIATGQTSDFKHGVFTTLTNGRAGKVHVVKSAGGYGEIACGWVKGSCVVSAFTPQTKLGVFPARAFIRHGKATISKLPSSSPAETYECISVGHCLAFGVKKPNQVGEHAVLSVVTKGKVAKPITVPGSASVGWMACVKVGSCVGVANPLKGQFPGVMPRSFTVTY